MSRRKMFGGPRTVLIAAISLLACAALVSGATAQVNADKQIHCVARRPGDGPWRIDLLIDFQHNTINGAPADGRFRKEASGDLNAYSIFSSNFILNVDAWSDVTGKTGVRSINYITIDRLHSAIRATSVTMPDARSISSRGDCEIVSRRAAP